MKRSVISSPHPLHSVEILPDDDELLAGPILPAVALVPKGPPPIAAGGSTWNIMGTVKSALKTKVALFLSPFSLDILKNSLKKILEFFLETLYRSKY